MWVWHFNKLIGTSPTLNTYLFCWLLGGVSALHSGILHSWFPFFLLLLKYLYFVFDICFMANTFIINMTVSTSMVLYMYGYTENKEMNEWMKSVPARSEAFSLVLQLTVVHCTRLFPDNSRVSGTKMWRIVSGTIRYNIRFHHLAFIHHRYRNLCQR